MSPVSRIIKKIDAKYSDDKNVNFGVLQGSGVGGGGGGGGTRASETAFLSIRAF